MFGPKKPVKQGTKSEKLIYEENRSTLLFYKIISLVTAAFFGILVLTFFCLSWFTKLDIILSSCCLIISLGAYNFMAYMAKAEYRENERGVLQLQDAGLDLNVGSGGLAEHAKDAILFCCAVMFLSLLHRYFWLLLLLLPGRLFQLLWVNILAPWIFDPNQGPQVNEKKQQKLERKMRRIGHLSQGRTSSGRT
ncbi:hypothetical protein EG68_05317 [Paragonimus skrjabini miyazakii]|uniref:Transmembrane protein 208 n=1 Tax=Paragonimus skrjabini miyazakii TaxID=59628 RepID=A0A8S9YRQ1_9TREM|nr:hypothetical protein EG68_05317 [Paragonimus skrjabini miyazakii]